MPSTSLPGTQARRRILLMRHGAVEYFLPGGRRVEDPDLVTLTEEGQRQARLMGDLLRETPIDLALHSGMARTEETARLVLGDRPVPLEAAPAFREIRTGPTDQIPPERLQAEFVYAIERSHEPGARFGLGDLFAEFHDRVVPAFEALLHQPGWTTLLLVAHGGTNRMILSWVAKSGLAGASVFEQDTGCLNIIDVDCADGVVLRRYFRAVNLTPYNLTKEGQYLTTLEQMIARKQQLAAGA